VVDRGQRTSVHTIPSRTHAWVARLLHYGALYFDRTTVLIDEIHVPES
jgi:hypothetical protein